MQIFLYNDLKYQEDVLVKRSQQNSHIISFYRQFDFNDNKFFNLIPIHVFNFSFMNFGIEQSTALYTSQRNIRITSGA